MNQFYLSILRCLLSTIWGNSKEVPLPAPKLHCVDIIAAPPPKNVERYIYEYVDRKNKDAFFTTNLL